MANGLFPEATITLSGCGIANGKELRSFLGHSSSVSSVAFSPDGKWALSGSLDKTIRLWDCQTGQELRSFLGHSEVFIAWRFPLMANGLFPEASIKLFGCGIAKPARSYALFLGIATMLLAWRFRPMANGLFPEADNTVRLWDRQTGKELCSFLGHSNFVTSVAFSPDGKWAFPEAPIKQ